MTKRKLLEKFLNQPTSIPYRKIEKILLWLGFTRIEAKGSHVKFNHPTLEKHLTIPLHHNECRRVYKFEIRSIIKNHLPPS